jgi:hypothetical protein
MRQIPLISNGDGITNDVEKISLSNIMRLLLISRIRRFIFKIFNRILFLLIKNSYLLPFLSIFYFQTSNLSVQIPDIQDGTSGKS